MGIARYPLAGHDRNGSFESKGKGRPQAAPPYCLERLSRRKVYGRAKTNTLFPRLKSRWLLPPAASAMYCLPPIAYGTGGEFPPAPPKNDHSFLPVFAALALKSPLPLPADDQLAA